MKRTLLTTLALILPLSLAQKGNTLDRLSWYEPGYWSVAVTLEGSFPNPSQTLTATVQCDQGVTSRDGNLFREWMTRTGSTVTGNQLTTPWIALSCEQGRLTAKAESIQAILKLMTTSVSVGQLGAEQNNRTGKASFSFLEQSGCVYPEIRYKCYWNYLLLSVENGVVKRDNPECTHPTCPQTSPSGVKVA